MNWFGLIDSTVSVLMQTHLRSYGVRREAGCTHAVSLHVLWYSMQVDVGERPVTGIRLYLEGKKSNMLAIHLQHLCSLPQILQLQDDPYNHQTPEPCDRKYLEPFGSWKRFSHVYTAPVESDDDSSIVTGAQLHVSSHGLTKVLFLRLHFSKVSNAVLVKNPEWEGSPNLGQKSGLISDAY